MSQLAILFGLSAWWIYSETAKIIEDLNYYISHLKGALDYFEKENPHSIELENVRALHEQGGERDDFGQLTEFFCGQDDECT